MFDPPLGGIVVHRSLNGRQGTLGEFFLDKAEEGSYIHRLSQQSLQV